MVLKLDCVLESSGEHQKMLMLLSHHQNSDLLGLGCGLGIREFLFNFY